MNKDSVSFVCVRPLSLTAKVEVCISVFLTIQPIRVLKATCNFRTCNFGMQWKKKGTILC